MGFADNVPAQQDAAEYVKNASEQMEEIPIRLCGHSKGRQPGGLFGSLFVQKRFSEEFWRSVILTAPDLTRRIFTILALRESACGRALTCPNRR